ncbi:hypothetical protein LTR85_000077 [Meristemomyces frigidus]|nr:hypothetical protein LTR85_000077 [Meristemomyces frigidus]
MGKTIRPRKTSSASTNLRGVGSLYHSTSMAIANHGKSHSAAVSLYPGPTTVVERSVLKTLEVIVKREVGFKHCVATAKHGGRCGIDITALNALDAMNVTRNFCADGKKLKIELARIAHLSTCKRAGQNGHQSQFLDIAQRWLDEALLETEGETRKWRALLKAECRAEVEAEVRAEIMAEIGPAIKAEVRKQIERGTRALKGLGDSGLDEDYDFVDDIE